MLLAGIESHQLLELLVEAKCGLGELGTLKGLGFDEVVRVQESDESRDTAVQDGIPAVTRELSSFLDPMPARPARAAGSAH